MRSRSAVLAGLFCRAFVITIVQGLGVVAFARGSLWAGVTAFAIQYCWSGNTRFITDHRPWGSRVVYGLGGTAGALVTLWLTGWKGHQ